MSKPVYKARIVDGREELARSLWETPEQAKTWLEGYLGAYYDLEPTSWVRERSADVKWSMGFSDPNIRAVVMGRDIHSEPEEHLESLRERLGDIRGEEIVTDGGREQKTDQQRVINEGEPPVDHHIAECDTCGRVERAGWSLDELNRLEDIFASHIDDGSACYGYSIERIYENGQGRTVA